METGRLKVSEHRMPFSYEPKRRQYALDGIPYFVARRKESANTSTKAWLAVCGKSVLAEQLVSCMYHPSLLGHAPRPLVKARVLSLQHVGHYSPSFFFWKSFGQEVRPVPIRASLPYLKSSLDALQQLENCRPECELHLA